MTDMIDPLANGFNYGPGWGSDPKPPIYLTGAQIARDLGRRAIQLSRESWEIEMAVRHVRIANAAPEKAQAIAKLATLIAKHLPTEA